MNKTCLNCNWMMTNEEGIDIKQGRCCANPPTVMVLPVKKSALQQQPELVLQSVWPSITFDDKCSKWEESFASKKGKEIQ